MTISAEHTWRSKLAALLRQWWRLQMSEKFSSGTKNSKQTKNPQKSKKKKNRIAFVRCHEKMAYQPLDGSDTQTKSVNLNMGVIKSKAWLTRMVKLYSQYLQ